MLKLSKSDLDALDALESSFNKTTATKRQRYDNTKEHVLIRIDKETGQHLEIVDVKSTDEISIRGQISEVKLKRDIAQAIAKNENDLSAQYSRELGGHVHMYYVKDKLLLDKLNISPQDKARLIYLSTFIEYNYKNDTNLLVKSTSRTSTEPITRQDIIQLLGLSDSTYKRFMKSMKDSKLINEVDKKFFLNNDYFTRGKISNKKLKTHEYTRIYRKPTQILFENSTPTEHKSIGDILTLLPYLNYDYNHLENMDGSYMTSKDICLLLGYEEGNYRRLFNKFRKITFEYCGEQHHVLAKVVLNDTEERIYINPMLTYKGNDTLSIKDIITKLIFASNKIDEICTKGAK